MQITDEGRIGIVLGLIGLAGAGAIMVAPEQLWIGWGLIALALLGFLGLLYHHWLASGKNRRVAAVLLASLGTALIVFGGIIGFVGALQMDAQGHASADGNLSKAQRILMARRWLALANDINADLPQMRNGLHPEFHPELPFQQKLELFRQQADLEMKNMDAQLNGMRGRYGGRVTLAQSEMLQAGVAMELDLKMSPPIFVNVFSFERWANKLGAEGRRILFENGEAP